MKVLAVVAHPDDELFGAGATLHKLARQGVDVYTCVLCSSADARSSRPDLQRLREVARDAAAMIGVKDSAEFDWPNIRFNVVPHIEIVQAIEETLRRFQPEWVFTHHWSDLNVDHRVCYEATMAAVTLPQRRTSKLPIDLIKKVLLCEVPSSTDWGLPSVTPFVPNTFFDVSDDLEAKLRALEAFEGALKPAPHPRSLESVADLAHLRGSQIGIRAAEAFVTVRDINF